MAAMLDQSDRDLEEQARSMISCAVCMEEFTEPRVLPCQHTFCQSCLKRCIDSATSTQGSRGFPCPSCRTVCSLTSTDDLSRLPGDFKVQQIRDMLKILENKATEAASSVANQSTSVADRGNQCVVCRYQGIERKAERFCVQCVKHFCAKCSVKHSKTSIFRDHLVVDTDEKITKSRGGSTSGGSIDSSARCDKHDSIFKYHCVECNESLCAVCAHQKEHNKHNILNLDTAAAQQTKNLQGLINQLGEKIFGYNSKLEVLGNARRRHSKLFHESEKEVKKAFSEAISLLKQQEEVIIKSLKTSQEEMLARMGGYEKELLCQQGGTRRVCDTIAEVLLPRTNAHELNQRYQGLLDLSDKELREPVNDDLPREFYEYKAFVPEVNVNIGSVIKRSFPSGSPEGLSRSKSAITLGSILDGQNTKEAPSPKPSKRWFSKSLINRKESSKSKQKNKSSDTESISSQISENIPPTISESASLPDIEPLISASSSSLRIHVITTVVPPARPTVAPAQVERPQTSQIQSAQSPTRIRVASALIRETFNDLSNGTPAVTSSPITSQRSNNQTSTRVTQITQSPRRNHTTVGQITTSSSGQNQISQTTRLIPPSNHRKDVILAGLGRRISTLPQSESAGARRPFRWKVEEFARCRDCCFIGDNKILTISGLRLKIFDCLLGRPSTSIQASGQIIEPWSLCHDSSNSTVVLTDKGSSGIKLLKLSSDRDGGIAGNPTVLSCPFQQPSGVAITRGGYYVITNTGSRIGSGSNNRVGIYTVAPGGQLAVVREFGATGCSDDEVLTPNFVAVDHNDRIVVTDCDGFQVKVFSLEGQMLLKFSSCGTNGRDMRPQGVAIDDDNNMLLVDQSLGGVAMFSPDGLLIDNLVEDRKGLGFGTPWGLGFDSASRQMALGTDKGLEMYQL